MYSVLFVCSANQCRSPMAMALFSDLIKKKGQKSENWSIDSAGCWAIAGLPATSGAVTTMDGKGLDLSDHRAKAVTEKLLEDYNLILCMERGHKRSLQRNFPSIADRVYLLSEMVSSKQEIDDPVGSPIGTYQNTINKIEYYLTEGFNRILELAA